LLRIWNGGFFIQGPTYPGTSGDGDGDRLPDDWEQQYPKCLDLGLNDAKADPDKDGLANFAELQHGTNPCRADTDRGGENDGSEVQGGRNPRNDPRDDKVAKLGLVNVRPLNQLVLIGWRRPLSYTNMRVYVSTVEGELGQVISMGQTIPFSLTNLQNGQKYWLTLQGVNDTAEGAYSDQISVTPKADPDMPSGVFDIEGGAEEAFSPFVTLDISATDTPLEGAAESSSGHTSSPAAGKLNLVSGHVQMRFSNDPNDLNLVTWEPFAPTKSWTLNCQSGEDCRVYGQFKDAADNISLVVEDNIKLIGPSLFLPLIVK